MTTISRSVPLLASHFFAALTPTNPATLVETGLRIAEDKDAMAAAKIDLAFDVRALKNPGVTAANRAALLKDRQLKRKEVAALKTELLALKRQPHLKLRTGD